MGPIDMLRHAATLSDDDVSRMAAALGWPTVEQVRTGEPFSFRVYHEPAHFWCEPEDRQRFEPYSVWVVGPMSVTDAGRCVVALRLLAEATLDDD
jgi:hypothetical protein